MPDALPDILAKNLSVVFVGLNPGRTAAVAGHHFFNRSNRFWRALHLSGFTPVQIAPQDDRSILNYGYGLTTAVARPTRSAAEVSRDEFTSSAQALERKLAALKPRAIAFLGKAAYAAITKTAKVEWGRQPAPFAGAQVWVLPNPSGLNRNFQLDTLVAAYRELRVASSEWQGRSHRKSRPRS
jgi:TDG/mug DNA glycosylase family protein